MCSTPWPVKIRRYPHLNLLHQLIITLLCSPKPRSESEDFVNHSEPINTFKHVAPPNSLSPAHKPQQHTPSFRTTGDLNTNGARPEEKEAHEIVVSCSCLTCTQVSLLTFFFLSCQPQILVLSKVAFRFVFLGITEEGVGRPIRWLLKVWVCGRDWGWCGGLEEVCLRSVVGVLE